MDKLMKKQRKEEADLKAFVETLKHLLEVLKKFDDKLNPKKTGKKR